MAMIRLPQDFKEFLQLLNSNRVEYLLIGGYAVGYHGYPRSTGDMDIWVGQDRVNANRLVGVLREFGFDAPELSPELFMEEERIIRMGVPPFRIELLTTISGVEFAECRAACVMDVVDGVEIPLISLEDLKTNKAASGRSKDVNDLENLP